MGKPFVAFPSWFLGIECDRCEWQPQDNEEGDRLRRRRRQQPPGAERSRCASDR